MKLIFHVFILGFTLKLDAIYQFNSNSLLSSNLIL